MKTANFETVERFLDPLLVLIVLLCGQLFATSALLSKLAPVELFIARIALEVVPIGMFLYIARNPLLTDECDIAIFHALFILVLLESYWLKTNLYDWLYPGLMTVTSNTTFTLTLLRLLMATSARTANMDWPVFGPLGLTQPESRPRQNKLRYSTLAAIIIIALEVTVIMMWYIPDWLTVLPAIIGLFLVARYARAVRATARNTLEHHAATAKTVEEYRAIIVMATQAIENLTSGNNPPPPKPPAAPKGPPHLKSVK